MNVVTARLVDVAITAVLAGLERSAVVEKVRAMELAGATPDEITDALQEMARQSEEEARNARPSG